MPRTWWVLPIAMGVAAACTRGDASRVTIRDSAGITITENASDAMARAAVWAIDSVPLLTIGDPGGDAAHQLYRARGAARLSDGRIVVLNAGTSELRFFDANGKHLRTVGRKGEGPGEFRLPFPLLHLPFDTLAVWDSRPQRVTIFSPDGEMVRAFVLDEPGVNAELIGVFADQSLVKADWRLIVPESGFEILPAVLTRYSATGAIMDSSAPIPGVRSASSIRLHSRSGAGPLRPGRPPHFTVTGSGSGRPPSRRSRYATSAGR